MEFSFKKTECSEFFGYLFKIRDRVHLTHLAQPDKTLGTHQTLNDFYKGLLDLTDSLIESYQGIYGIIPIKIPESVSGTNAIAIIEECYNYIQEYRGVFKESFLQNQIDEISQLIASTLYKLKFVK